MSLCPVAEPSEEGHHLIDKNWRLTFQAHHQSLWLNIDFLRDHQYPAARSFNCPHRMAPIDRCLASMARLSLLQTPRPTIPTIPRFLAPAAAAQQVRNASVVRIRKTTKKKRPIPKDFKRHNITKRDFPQHSLCEAMRLVGSNGWRGRWRILDFRYPPQYQC